MKFAAYLLIIPLSVLILYWHEIWWHIVIVSDIAYLAAVLMEKSIQRGREGK